MFIPILLCCATLALSQTSSPRTSSAPANRPTSTLSKATSTTITTAIASATKVLSKNTNKNKKAMIGGIVGGIIVLLIIVGIIVWLFWRKRKQIAKVLEVKPLHSEATASQPNNAELGAPAKPNAPFKKPVTESVIAFGVAGPSTNASASGVNHPPVRDLV